MNFKYFRYLLLTLASIFMVSCDDDNTEVDLPPSPGEGLTLSVSKQVIQANGTDCSDFIVKYDGMVLNEGYSIYGENDIKLENNKQFSTNETGEYKFWASYKSSHTENVTVKAIGVSVPTLPADPNPACTDFTKRILMTQFTGSGCQFCPKMTKNVNEALSDPAYAEKSILCVAHTFNQSDPAFLVSCPALSQAFGVSSYPTLNLDFVFASNNYIALTADSIHAVIDGICENPAKAGISAKAERIDDADGKKIVLHVSVKAAEEGVYSVGAWLMEDSIRGPQMGSDQKIINHNNAIRIVDSRAGSRNYTGVPLGKINKGKTAEHVFIMNLEDKWNLENCHMAIFVASTKDHKISVTNAVRCPIEGELLYDYKE